MKLYLDSSALVKLLFDEDGSATAFELLSSASDLLCASIGLVETRSVIARRASGRRAAHLRRRAAHLWKGVHVVDVDDGLVEQAARIADESCLRALDAVHLAAARSVADRRFVLATWDAELGEAARAAGLNVAP